jgi:hypothetical protein
VIPYAYVYAYAADGVVSLPDMTENLLPLTPIDLSQEPYTFQVDATDHVRSLLLAGASHVGFLVTAVGFEAYYAMLMSHEGTPRFGIEPPALVIEHDTSTRGVSRSRAHLKARYR